MWDFSLRRSLTLMVQTMPFILLRCVVYFGIALAYILFTGMGAGVGWGIGALGDEGFQTSASIWGGVAGFGITAAILYFLREYLLYMVKAGHIAVLVNLIDGQPLPEGRSQIAHAQQIVKSRYAQANVLFALDQIVKGVIAAITGLVQGVASILPIPGISQLMGLVRAFLRLAVGLIDEVILAYAIRTESQNPWSSAQTALVLYGQNGKNMLKNAAWLAIFTYGLSFLVFLAMLAPAAAVVYMIPGAWSAGGFLFALVFAWAIKAALIEPFAIACMLQAYFKAIEGQQPDPEWEARIDGVSGKFRKLKDKAADWARGNTPDDDAEPARAGTGP
ncbi:hypothetical protein [Pusillimonas sp. ANT_WB101]|uniref:hypothetical protein n=1 Tax=Pusillimonas sp. ANT_WB101 TaxID=2597356 RepID=UPI0011EE9415|nr:hypothetical protein [Pusillimonas sp. ANT_WB101]KAA0891001.1 hypothetical protein FQ179_15265 [Pusillimonas sp. ANT_WB101]